MKERFEGPGHQNLLDAVIRQEFACGDIEIANALVKSGELLEFEKGVEIIKEGGQDNDVYLLLAGSVSIVIKGHEYRTREAGQHVGEMAAIEPSQKRSASVVTHNTLVTLKVSSASFMEIGRQFPQIWLPIARELARRVFQRNDLIVPPNESPKLFIISSSEAIEVAREVQSQLQRDVLSTVWTDGVFFAGGYVLEALEKSVAQSDFAVAIAQPDDVVESRGSRLPTLRDNVLFELGLFMGKLSRHRAILIHPRVKDLKLPSDLQGLTLIAYEPGKADELTDRIGPACNDIRKLVKKLGVRFPAPH